MASTSFNIGDTEQQINSLSEQIAQLTNNVNVYKIRGKQTKIVSGFEKAWGGIVISYNSVWKIYSASGSTIEVASISVADTSLSSSGTTLTFGSDANRIYVVIVPSGITLS